MDSVRRRVRKGGEEEHGIEVKYLIIGHMNKSRVN